MHFHFYFYFWFCFDFYRFSYTFFTFILILFKIARVAVGLCQNKSEIAEIIKTEFFRICPLTVPRQAEGGLTGNDMFENMGFLKIENNKWEESEQWQIRMNKVLCAFAVTLIQPEGVPFNLSDGWKWIANMINTCSR